MKASWWWIDRWRKSTAYTDMTLAEQGAYRNLLDELWLRDGLLPVDERILGKVSGDAVEWPNVRVKVLSRFRLTPDGWRNDTHDDIAAESRRLAEKQKRYRSRAGNVAGNVTGDVTRSPSPSPSPVSGSGEEKRAAAPRARSARAPLDFAGLNGSTLNTEAFRDAWTGWEAFHGSYKPAGLKAQIGRLERWGEPRAVAALTYSLGQEYDGIHEERGAASLKPVEKTSNHGLSRNLYVGSPEWCKANGYDAEEWRRTHARTG